MVTCASPANSCLAGPVCLSEVRHNPQHHRHHKRLELRRWPWGKSGASRGSQDRACDKKTQKMSSWPFVFLWSTYGGNYRCCPEGILQNTAGASGRAQEGGLPEGRGGEPRAGVRFPHHEEIVWLGFWNHKMLSAAKGKKWECRTGDKGG